MQRGDVVVEKYIKIYLKRNSILALICAALVFIPLLIVSLVYDVLSYDLIIAFVPFEQALFKAPSKVLSARGDMLKVIIPINFAF